MQGQGVRMVDRKEFGQVVERDLVVESDTCNGKT